MSRQIERAIARREYAGFCRTWARERRMAGDDVRVPRPTFRQWMARREGSREISLPMKGVAIPASRPNPWKDDLDPWKDDEA